MLKFVYTYKHEFALQGYFQAHKFEFIRNLKLIVLLVVCNLLDGEFIEWNSNANLTNLSIVGIWNQICCWLSATCKMESSLNKIAIQT